MRHVCVFSSVALAGVFLLGVAGTVSAGSFPMRLETNGPHCKVALEVPEWRSVWLGHFTGGNPATGSVGQRSVDWADEYSCFPSQAACQSWLRHMRATFRKVDGYRTCLLIRRGPLREDPPPEDRLDRESDVTVVVTPPPQDLRRPRRQASVARPPASPAPAPAPAPAPEEPFPGRQD